LSHGSKNGEEEYGVINSYSIICSFVFPAESLTVFDLTKCLSCGNLECNQVGPTYSPNATICFMTS